MQGPSSPNLQTTQLPLRDIHLPEAISWWPPAIGWWLLALLVGGLLWAVWVWLKNRRLRNEYRLAAQQELEMHYEDWLTHNSASLYLQAVSEVLKRIMRHLNSDTRVLSLSGRAWLDALAARTNTPLSDELKDALSQQLYQRDAVVDIPSVHAEIMAWVSDHYLKQKEQVDA